MSKPIYHYRPSGKGDGTCSVTGVRDRVLRGLSRVPADIAEDIAFALNLAYEGGKLDVRNEIKKALNI